ncbi:MAG: single-stranded-DNA-specific exonuclease RecJ [Oculatellaceae cyanobacterium bins.114]|nr:single-stranded-DNA-specific exonuclease RecJ [Oculatellaceae cyanobacterium bins.114]
MDHPVSDTHSDFTKPIPRASRLPSQRWHIAEPQPQSAMQLAQTVGLSPLLAQVLINRGVDTSDRAQSFLNPETDLLPSPLEEFADLPTALELLMWAIANQHYIAICGDYDADGMTSTALLLRALRFLGAQVDYAIPSRMNEGYGINKRIVEDFHQEGVRLILTVDNGIAAYEPIARARELGLAVIVTDHHDIPEKLPPANAILNPKLIREASPYRGVAGVGVAYILAVCLAQCLKKTQDLTAPLIELFTLGTIADLAPLTGVNRRWVRRGLRLLPKSRLIGVQALIQVAGLSNERDALKPEAIGFRLGPRINAVGRIADPQLVIELLTTNDEGQALELAMKCEQVNQLRQRLCELIEQEAIAWCETSGVNVQQDQVLVVVQPEWHHGVIGIVASRLVERYGVPVFIGTYEGEEKTHIRGSARGIPEFNVFEALQFCGDILGKFGGHKAAGGFSLAAENLTEMRSRLRIFAAMKLQPQHLKPLVNIDVEANFDELDLDLYEQIDHLHPCGIENPDPVFWTPNVRVLEQKVIGKDRSHLKVTLAQDTGVRASSFKAIAWRWGEYCPLPNRLDVAYRLRVNEWNGDKSVELELVGVRLPSEEPLTHSVQVEMPLAAAIVPPTEVEPAFVESSAPEEMAPQAEPLPRGAIASTDDEMDETQALLTRSEFQFSNRQYTCSISVVDDLRELQIRNAEGQVLTVQPEHQRGLLGQRREEAKEVDISQPFYADLIQAALRALEIVEKDELLKKKDQLIAEQEQHIARLQHQLDSFQQQASQLPLEPPTVQSRQTNMTGVADAVSRSYPTSPILRSHSTVFDPEQTKETLKTHLGDAVWYCIDQRSQKDLYAAYKKRNSLQTNTLATPPIDYSEAGIKLILTIEREVLHPCFKVLYEFLQTQSEIHSIAGIELGNRTKYTLKQLVPLIDDQWSVLRDSALQNPNRPDEKDLYFAVSADEVGEAVNESDFAFLTKFFDQWEHPLADWLVRDSNASASAIAQIAQLRERAVDSDRLLYEWQFEYLRVLVVGDTTQQGILQAIYNSRKGIP